MPSVGAHALPRRLSRWQVAILVLALVGSTAYALDALFATAPAPESLERATVTLESPVQLVSASGKSRGPYAVLAWMGGKATVEHLCFLSNCALPEALAGLQSGDRVTLALKADNVWEIEHGDRKALHYDDMRVAYEAAMRRRCMVSVPLWAASILLVTLALVRRRPFES